MCNTSNENYIGESANTNQKVRTRQKVCYINLRTPCTSFLTWKEVNMLTMENCFSQWSVMVWAVPQGFYTLTYTFLKEEVLIWNFRNSIWQLAGWKHTKALCLRNTSATEKRDKHTAGRVMTGESRGKKHSERNAVSRRGEGVRQRGGMMCLTVSVGFLLNKLLPQILGTFADKFSLIKVTEMPTCLHTSIKCWYICHSQWKSSKGF